MKKGIARKEEGVKRSHGSGPDRKERCRKLTPAAEAGSQPPASSPPHLSRVFPIVLTDLDMSISAPSRKNDEEEKKLFSMQEELRQARRL